MLPDDLNICAFWRSVSTFLPFPLLLLVSHADRDVLHVGWQFQLRDGFALRFHRKTEAKFALKILEKFLKGLKIHLIIYSMVSIH